MSEFHWRHVAVLYPEFVAWVVQKYGPLPDGPVAQEDYEKYARDYTESMGLERRRWK
jgi:hypothetical protein